MKKVMSSLIGLTAVFTFMFNASNVTDTQKLLARIKSYNMLTAILVDDK